VNNKELADAIKEAVEQAKQYQTCMSLSVHNDGQAVELILDTGLDTYGEWIPGEGGDIYLIRCQESKRVVGVRLPLLKTNLAVFHSGPLTINDGFKKASNAKEPTE
jgi:hypothetical protein